MAYDYLNDSVKTLIDDVQKAIREAYENGYSKGHKDGKVNVENKSGATEYINQIERMARQIEECHDTIRRRNATIREQDSLILNLRGTGCHCG